MIRETADRSGAERAAALSATADRPISAGSRGGSIDTTRESPSDGRGTWRELAGGREGSIRPEDAYQARQEAGLAVLAEIASHASLVMADVGTTIIPTLPAWPQERLGEDSSEGRDGVVPGDSAAGARLGQVGSLQSRLRADHLVRNSLYLMASAGVQAALGFTFWIVMARLFSAEEVGKASSLISATSFIAYFALVGLNTTLMRFLPTARNKGPLLTAACVMVLGIGAAIALGYVLLTPVVAPRLAFVAHSPVMTAGFTLLTAATAINLLTKSVFVAERKAGLCVVTDGLVGGVGKILFGVVLAGTGAYGLYLASAGGLAAAGLVSIVLIVRIFRWKPSLRNPLRTLKPLLKFSGANYVANALNMLPSVVVPLIVLDRLGAGPAGYYFVAFQMAALLYGAVYSIESSFLAEGSQANADWRAIRRRSRRLAIVLFVPGGVVLTLGAHWVLLAFGSGYSQHGTGSLEVLAAAVLPIAACNWCWTVLQLTGRLGTLVMSTAVYAAAICGSAWFLAPHGLTALSSAWLAGSALAAAVAAAVGGASKPQARHRRTRRPAAAPSMMQSSG